jgi:hypothetical protein
MGRDDFNSTALGPALNATVKQVRMANSWVSLCKHTFPVPEKLMLLRKVLLLTYRGANRLGYSW